LDVIGKQSVNIIAFGERLKRFRVLRGLTQLALAKRASVPQSVISDLEAGKREGVTLEMAWRLARELSVSLDHLAGTWEDVAASVPPEDAAPAAGAPAQPRSRRRRASTATRHRGRTRTTTESG
jgi:transcriptional regulator with XRE-family HTH domain